MKRIRLKIIRMSSGISAKHIFASLLPLLITLLILATPALGLRLTHVKLLFDITYNFNAPSDVSVSKFGLIYVVDGVNHSVKAFSRSGKFAFSFGRQGSGDGEFRFPLGIGIDSSGKVYVADSGNHRIQIFDPRGKFITKIRIPGGKNHLSDPTDVAVDDSRNRCYVVDNDNHHILGYDLKTRNLIKTYGAPGTDKRGFRYPFLMTLDSNKYLYIVDVINTRVQVLNPEGLFVAFIGGWGVEKGEFFRPKGVAIDNAGRIYVSDSYLGVIQVFDQNGEFYSVLSDPKKDAVKKFKSPVGLSIDKNNRLYVVEMFANKVGVYQIQGDSEK